jgi:hypothetical protein
MFFWKSSAYIDDKKNFVKFFDKKIFVKMPGYAKQKK